MALFHNHPKSCKVGLWRLEKREGRLRSLLASWLAGWPNLQCCLLTKVERAEDLKITLMEEPDFFTGVPNILKV